MAKHARNNPSDAFSSGVSSSSSGRFARDSHGRFSAGEYERYERRMTQPRASHATPADREAAYGRTQPQEGSTRRLRHDAYGNSADDPARTARLPRAQAISNVRRESPSGHGQDPYGRRQPATRPLPRDARSSRNAPGANVSYAQQTRAMPQAASAGRPGHAQASPRMRQPAYGVPQGSPAFAPVPTRGKRKLGRTIAIGVGVLLALILASVLFFMFQLDNRLSIQPAANREAIENSLVSMPLDEPFYTLILGSDSREDSQTSDKIDESGDNQRSDVIMLARIDARNRLITLVSVPRDTPYFLDDGTVVKINEAYNYGGAAQTIQAVSALTGAPISHYAEVHFSDVQAIVDALGGVDVQVPVTLSYVDALTGEEVTIPEGKQHLDGQQAQIFARARHEYVDQDVSRQKAVRSLLLAMVNGVTDRPMTEIPGTVLSLADHVSTDLRSTDLVSLAMAYMGGTDSMTVYQCTGPTEGDYNIYNNDMWMCYDNPEGWQRIMEAVDAGLDPSGIDPNA